ncbi:hypothetical protein ACOMHN_046584 [Nucella lapillus]
MIDTSGPALLQQVVTMHMVSALCVDYSLYDRHQWARPPSASGHHAHGVSQVDIQTLTQHDQQLELDMCVLWPVS